ncbi:hypothetical protein A8C32_14460 [Flavivirga aquatica]|uniref:Stress-response A/B barrel domain-containing protein n=1 Tax=Flavivirga aquatica TaxID=1849968 RepID=A0A1E5TCG2_9FLAO|nr:Dabb family protein [Flavivirga aquatica]OEK09083.1 hypothetical protein A8C32_14460 [Flavivirga aquatica]
MKIYRFLLVVTFLITSCVNKSDQDSNKTTQIDKTENTSKQLRHVVLFKFKDSTSAAAIKKAEDAFAALPSKISGITGFEWGLNNSPQGLNKEFTHCYFLTFDGEDGREMYIPHPAHLEFGDLLTPILEDVLVLDYWSE